MKQIIILLLVLAISISVVGCTADFWPFADDSDPSGSTENLPKPELAEMGEVEKTVIIDMPTARVSVLGTYNVGFKLLYENFSEKELNFRTEILSVNSYTMPTSYFGGSTVEANNKHETTEYVSSEDLLKLGIRSITDIEIQCLVEEENGLFDETLFSKKKKFFFEDRTDIGSDSPFITGIKDGSYEALTSSKIDYFFESEIIHRGGLKISAAALTESNLLLLEFENTTATDIHISLENFTVNGIVLNNRPSSSPSEYETILARTRYVAEIGITPPTLVQDCFGIDSIADVTFLLEIDNDIAEVVSISIPGRDATLDTSGVCFLTYESVRATYKGIYYREEEWAEYHNGDIVYEDRDVYEMVLYVENGSSEEIHIELEEDSLFLNYKKTAFGTYDSVSGERYQNFGSVPAGYCGYIILKIDASSIQENNLRDLDSITEIEMNVLLDFGYIHGEYSERVTFTVP